MTRGEEFDKSMKLAMKGDFSLHDEIIHQDYESINQGITINKEMSKTILSGVGDFTIIGPMYTIYENDKFACIHQYSKISNVEMFYSVMTAITYKNGKVVNQQTVREELDYDPSEGQDWNWEDYE
ncbi:MAG: hypothetical protein VXZ27_11435 [SAR324 cluster bacterium]|nr:hypothetical protein [SAR324 cluster bacterium]